MHERGMGTWRQTSQTLEAHSSLAPLPERAGTIPSTDLLESFAVRCRRDGPSFVAQSKFRIGSLWALLPWSSQLPSTRSCTATTQERAAPPRPQRARHPVCTREHVLRASIASSPLSSFLSLANCDSTRPAQPRPGRGREPEVTSCVALPQLDRPRTTRTASPPPSQTLGQTHILPASLLFMSSRYILRKELAH